MTVFYSHLEEKLCWNVTNENTYTIVHTATLSAGKLHYFSLSAEMPDRFVPTMHILQAAVFSFEQRPL